MGTYRVTTITQAMNESRSTFLAGVTVLLFASLVSGGLQAWRSGVSLRQALEVSPVAEAAATEGFPVVDLATMKAIVEQGTHLILDARPQSEYDQGHLPGAFSLPEETFETSMMNLVGLFGPGDPLVIYCSSATCDDALLVARRLREAGFQDLSLFLEGWEGWSP